MTEQIPLTQARALLARTTADLSAFSHEARQELEAPLAPYEKAGVVPWESLRALNNSSEQHQHALNILNSRWPGFAQTYSDTQHTSLGPVRRNRVQHNGQEFEYEFVGQLFANP